MYCPMCGKPTPENARFCPNCAAPLASAAPAWPQAPAGRPVPLHGLSASPYAPAMPAQPGTPAWPQPPLAAPPPDEPVTVEWPLAAEPAPAEVASAEAPSLFDEAPDMPATEQPLPGQLTFADAASTPPEETPPEEVPSLDAPLAGAPPETPPAPATPVLQAPARAGALQATQPMAAQPGAGLQAPPRAPYHAQKHVHTATIPAIPPEALAAASRASSAAPQYLPPKTTAELVAGVLLILLGLGLTVLHTISLLGSIVPAFQALAAAPSPLPAILGGVAVLLWLAGGVLLIIAGVRCCLASGGDATTKLALIFLGAALLLDIIGLVLPTSLGGVPLPAGLLALLPGLFILLATVVLLVVIGRAALPQPQAAYWQAATSPGPQRSAGPATPALSLDDPLPIPPQGSKNSF